MIVFLPMEVKVRDFDSRTYLALKLAARGYACVVGAKSGVHRCMKECRGQFVYVTKGARLDSGPFFESIKEQGGSIAYLDEEGAFYGDPRVFLDRNHPDLLRHVDLYCCWGQHQRDVLAAEKLDALPKRIAVTGNPRFDLRKPPFKSVYHATSSEQNPNTILINTSFGGGNNIVDIQRDRDYYERTSERSLNRRHTIRVQKYQELLVEYFIDLAITLAEAFPDLEVILRPHPVENADTYRRVLQTVPRVRVCNQGSVQSAIASSVAVIHHDCTTSIEAILFGKSVVSYQPVLDPALVAKIPLQSSPAANNLDELVDFVRNALHAPKTGEQLWRDQPSVQQYIANLDFSATDRIVELFEDSFEPTETRLPFAEKDSPQKPLQWMWHLKKSVGAAIQPRQDSKLQERANKKMPGIEEAELSALVERLRQSDQDLSHRDFHVEPIQQNTFTIGASVATP